MLDNLLNQYSIPALFSDAFAALNDMEQACFLMKYVDYSNVFGPAQAALAGISANRPGFPLDISKSIFLGAADEFDDAECGGVTHRFLSAKLNSALTALVGESCECPARFKQTAIDAYELRLYPSPYFGFGFHLAVEFLADYEYNAINRYINPQLKQHLEAADSYTWISRHCSADADHLAYALAGLKLVPADKKIEVKRGIDRMFLLEHVAISEMIARVRT
jgi:hypothetical protein